MLTAYAEGKPLTAAERTLVSELGFDAALMTRVKGHGQALERLQALTKNGDMAPAHGVALVIAPSKGEGTLTSVRAALAGTRYGAWLRENHFGFAADKIAIMKSRDDFAFLAIVRTDAINFGRDHEVVLARYRKWQKLYGLELIGADLDWIAARITRPPPDWMVFAREVYDFCPDVVDQGVGDVKALADGMRKERFLYLWWD